MLHQLVFGLCIWSCLHGRPPGFTKCSKALVHLARVLLLGVGVDLVFMLGTLGLL